ncbi:MAG: archease [Planctomycetes bacterium]|nr:archease [Planctomycetota bacterium]
MPFTFLDHTGDIGIRVTAPTLEGIFVEAAGAFLSIVTDPAAVTAREAEAVEVEGDDLADLLNRWLTWLLLRLAIEGRLYGEVRGARVEGGRFRCDAAWEAFVPERHELRVELKAVTYHQLFVRPVEGGGGWEAQVIFDV